MIRPSMLAIRYSVLLLCTFGVFCGSSQAAAEKPNIIHFYTDDHGDADLGIRGVLKDIKTPHTDRAGRHPHPHTRTERQRQRRSLPYPQRPRSHRASHRQTRAPIQHHRPGRVTFEVTASDDFTSHEIALPATGTVIHVRLHLPGGITKIRSIEFKPKAK
jgi:hypothetical protein